MSSKKQLAKRTANATATTNAPSRANAVRKATTRVEKTLSEVENLVVNASHVPLTGKSMIDENDLIHLVEELRQDLPLELEHAQEIMANEAEIIEEAHRQNPMPIRF